MTARRKRSKYTRRYHRPRRKRTLFGMDGLGLIVLGLAAFLAVFLVLMN